MTRIDTLLQQWRIRKASPYIQPGHRVLDLGSVDGALFKALGRCGPGSLGIDPTLDRSHVNRQGFRMISGYFPADVPADAGPFDVIVMLAVLEHFPTELHRDLAAGCARLLRPGGRLVITVPSVAVDLILDVLLKLGLIHGQSLEEHHGYEPDDTTGVFPSPCFRLLTHETFQLGLNHLFVLERTEALGG
jgi:SAM-dependent methyltransferase